MSVRTPPAPPPAAVLVRHGFVPGTDRTGAIWLHHADESPRPGSSSPTTVDDAVSALRAAGARMIVAELPRDRAHATLEVALIVAGFARTGRVRDHADESVDLDILRLVLDG